MTTIRFTMLATVFGALTILSGCTRYVVDIRSGEPISAGHQGERMGNIHILPIEKGPLIYDVEPGVANLDHRWAILNHNTESTSVDASLAPSEFVTTADLAELMRDRTVTALQHAGFSVTEGSSIPDQTDVIIVQSLQLAFVSLSGPSCPTAIVQTWTHFRDVNTGAHTTDIIIGHGRSFQYVTLEQGLGRAMDEALDEYQAKLVQDTKDSVTYLVENRASPPRKEGGGYRAGPATDSALRTD